VYWQLCPDGRVSGINGDVDINVFNGYQAQFDEFVRTGFHR
jgi:lysozyme